MCLQDLAIALKYRSKRFVQTDGAGTNGNVKGDQNLWSIFLLQSAAGKTVTINFSVGGAVFTSILAPDAGAVLRFELTRAEAGQLFDEPWTITDTNLTPCMVVLNYLDPDQYTAALEM